MERPSSFLPKGKITLDSLKKKQEELRRKEEELKKGEEELARLIAKQEEVEEEIEEFPPLPEEDYIIETKESLELVVEPSLQNVIVTKEFDPKVALEHAFMAEHGKLVDYMTLSKWFKINGYVRRGGFEEFLKDGKTKNPHFGKNVWDFLGSLYRDNGWPMDRVGKRYVSVDTAKSVLGKNHPAVLRIQAYKQWVSATFIDIEGEMWVEKALIPPPAKPPKPPIIPGKDNRTPQQVLDEATKDFHALKGFSTNLQLDDLDKDLQEAVSTKDEAKALAVNQKIKQRENDLRAKLVQVGMLSPEQLHALQKEVLSAIVKAEKGIYSDKAKTLAADLLSELGLVN